MEYCNISPTLIKVSDFVTYFRQGQVLLRPWFQRNPVWSDGAKSYFIDTLAKGLPVPSIFLRWRPDLAKLGSKYEVVDGQQRLRTVISYLAPNLLDDYREDRDSFTVRKNHNAELAGKPFRDLPDKLQTRILEYKFTVHELPSSVSDAEVLQIFARINSTGTGLNAQELRNATYFGEFKDCAYTLAYEQLERWLNWGLFTEPQVARMSEVEFTSDLILLILSGVSASNKSALDRLYRENEDTFSAKPQVTRRFRKTMDAIDDLMGGRLSESPFSNKVLFYPLFALVHDVLYGLGTPLKARETPGKLKGLGESVDSLAAELASRSGPDEVTAALVGRTTHLNVRQSLVRYFIGKHSHA